jgi:flagellar motility protein MotE (MotC chaperone)
MRLPRPRLLPMALLAMTLLLPAKLASLLRGMPGSAVPRMELVAEARASAPAPAPPPRAAAPTPPPAPAAPPEPTPDQLAERALLESLRGRRAEMAQREQALQQREMLLAATERRLTQRLEEMAALQRRLEVVRTQGSEREEAGWRQLVKTYETMRPRDAAGIFDELEMTVLVQVVDRMREAKVAPILGAMKPERARLLTTELAHHRARPPETSTP